MGAICEFAAGRLPDSALFAFNTNVDAVAKLEHLPGLKLPGIKESIAKCGQKEVLIDAKAAEMLSKYRWEKTVGGQAGRCAQAAAYLGVRAYLNIPVSCREQNRHLHPFVNCAHKGGFVPAGRVGESGKPPIHYVIEYERGIRIAGRVLRCSNRFIASYNGKAGLAELEPEFGRLILGKVGGIRRAVLGGVHLLPERESGKVGKIARLIREWKGKSPHLKIHFECGEFQSGKVARLFLKEIAPLCDSIGVNRLECRQLGAREGNAFEAAASLLSHAKCVVLHEPQFSASLSQEDVRWEALAFGNLVAAFYLEHGRLGGMGELEEYEPKGRAADRFTFEYRNAKIGCASQFVPSYAILPKLTVGGGDAFAAGFALTS